MVYCFWQMRDWKVVNLANGKEISTVPLATEKKGLPSLGSIQFLNRFYGKLGCLPLNKIIRKFRLKVKWNKNFCENPIRDCRIPPEVNLLFRSEREFDPKWGPPSGAFDFPFKTPVSSRKEKDFAILCFSTWAAFTGHCSCRFHVGCCRFI